MIKFTKIRGTILRLRVTFGTEAFGPSMTVPVDPNQYYGHVEPLQAQYPCYSDTTRSND